MSIPESNSSNSKQNVEEAGERPRSLRRELNEKQLLDLIARHHHVGEPLASKSREELESEVRNLRQELFYRDLAQLMHDHRFRNLLSHQTSGRPLYELDYLHLEKLPESIEMKQVLKEAGHRALGGGLPGAFAMVTEVTTMMWLRTTMNYQYKYGTSTKEAFKRLYKQGGVMRFYRGYFAALAQGPLSRFGDTAANAGMMSLLDSTERTRGLPVAVKTMAASGAAALWRINLMPIDTIKTTMQVEGNNGFRLLRNKMKVSGVRTFYQGALGASAATFVGHYPWFFTYNQLNATIPKADTITLKLARNAFMGFCSSAVSDCVSNSLRVVKTTKQTSARHMTYLEVTREVLQSDGIQGLLGRGLRTRLIANGMQGMMFSVVWKAAEAYMHTVQQK